MSTASRDEPIVTIMTKDFAGQNAPDVSLAISERACIELTRRVLASGRRRVAFHCHPEGSDIAQVADGRQGPARGGPVASRPERRGHDLGAGAGRHLAKRRDEIDTIFCINDLAAAAVLTEVMSIGMRVPQDLLLIGFDGVVKLPGVWTAVADVQ